MTAPQAQKKSKKAEQSEETRAKLLAVGRRLFTEKGFSATGTEELVGAANVTRGALYHQFRDKRDLFRAVFEQLEQEIVEQVMRGAVGDDIWQALHAGVEAFFKASLDPAVQRIVLIDGPSVLGWDEWRQIDDRYGYGLIRASVQQAMDAGLLPEQPVEPLARILLAILNEAVLQVARAKNRRKATDEMMSTVFGVMDGLRTPQKAKGGR